ncbi:MAG: hypothetical protein V1875_02935 [Candidatus Altiarchaeota archaeon]
MGGPISDILGSLGRLHIVSKGVEIISRGLDGGDSSPSESGGESSSSGDSSFGSESSSGGDSDE